MGIWREKTKVFILGMRVTIDIFKDCNRFLYAKKEIVLKTFLYFRVKNVQNKVEKKTYIHTLKPTSPLNSSWKKSKVPLKLLQAEKDANKKEPGSLMSGNIGQFLPI